MAHAPSSDRKPGAPLAQFGAKARTALLWLVGLLLLGLLAWPVLRRPLPEPVQRGPAVAQVLPQSPLSRGLADALAGHPGQSGVYPLADGHDAFAARAALAEVAQHRIDAQYYIWRDDVSGRLLLQALRRAAERGVQVRLLLDDNNTGGLDPVLVALDAHANIEVRLFNPFMHRQMRVLDFVTDFQRLNRRMHNKSFTVDGSATVVGGRNVGDEYFGVGDGVMFVDLDVLTVGPVVADVGADFERYWTSASSYSLQQIVTDPVRPLDPGTQAASDAATNGYQQALTRSGLVQRLRDGNLVFEWARAQLVSDDPVKGLGQAASHQTLLGQLPEVLAQARKQVTLVSPYFVPTSTGTALLAGLAERGVAVSVLTNALAATDVAAVHAGYARSRADLLRAGVRVFELKPDATVRTGSHLEWSGSSGASLHAKTFQIDAQQLFVGSFNFDPRSATLNTEMGLLIDSPVLAARLPQALAEHGAQNAYEVTLDADSASLRWTTQEGGQRMTYAAEPHSSLWRRASVRVLSWLPIDALL